MSIVTFENVFPLQGFQKLLYVGFSLHVLRIKSFWFQEMNMRHTWVISSLGPAMLK